MEQQPNNQLNIEISEEIAEGDYANLAIITHSHAEFVIDFVSVMPGVPKSRVKSRIIFTPMHAKRFMKALEENNIKLNDKLLVVENEIDLFDKKLTNLFLKEKRK